LVSAKEQVATENRIAVKDLTLCLGATPTDARTPEALKQGRPVPLFTTRLTA